MTTFPQVPALHECDRRGRQRVFALCGDLYYPDGDIVPRGFKTDGASRPWFVRKWIKKFGKGFAAFIKHDRDYAMQQIPREVADRNLCKLLTLKSLPEAERFSEDEAQLIFLALSVFGWVAWRRNQRRPLWYFYCTEDELNTPTP